MSFKLDWNNLPSSGPKSGGGGGKKFEGRPLNFLKFTDNSTHIVRPVGAAYAYWRFWYKAARKYIIAKVIVDEEGKVIESNLEELKELLDCDPEQRFAMNVIDRADNQIKILQGPMNMAQDFAEVAQHSGNSPGGSNGGDWKITSKGAGKSRRYHCNFTGPQPFSQEELARIKNPDKEKNEWYVLEQVFKPSDMEYVHKLVNAQDEPASADVPSTSDVVGTGKAQVGAAVGCDDLYF